MPSLHESTDLTKKIAIWGGLALVVIILLVFTFRAGVAIKNYLIPPGPPPPTVGFGRLEVPAFPKNTTEEKLQYKLETISGLLPSFPTQLAVYKITEDAPGLLNFQRTKERVANVGFTGTEQKESDNLFRWTDNSPLTRTMIIDPTSNNFTLNTFYPTSQAVLESRELPDESSAIEVAKGFLGEMDVLPEDIDITKTTPQLFSIANGILIPASSFSTTQIIRVDFFQRDLDDLPMFYEHPPASSMSFLIAGREGTREYEHIVDAQFYHHNITDEKHTYPIKSAEQAFKELTEGKAYIASYFGTSREVKITEIVLGYYLSKSNQNYATPVIVFKGDGQFYAYVYAVEESWLKR